MRRRRNLKDYRVFVASNQTGVDTTWSEEYDFAKTYNEDAFTAASDGDLIAGFKADPTAKNAASQSYIRNYSAGGGRGSSECFGSRTRARSGTMGRMRSGIVCAQGGEAAELAELAGLAELLDAN